jgi:hypothetical protein
MTRQFGGGKFGRARSPTSLMSTAIPNAAVIDASGNRAHDHDENDYLRRRFHRRSGLTMSGV